MAVNWQTTFIIGGGPSATEIDTSLWRNGVRLGVNDAAFHKECDAFFSNDHGYALGIRGKIEAFEGERHLAIRPRHLERFGFWAVRHWIRVDQIDPSMKGAQLSSGPAGTPGCSGYVALNLAAQMGAKRIILFGYDFEDDYRYFFAGPYPRIKIPEVRQSFRKVAPWYAARGIEILNANPASAIDAFPRITHAEALQIS